MHNALRYGFVASFVVAGCVVAGVEIDPSLGDGDQTGKGGDAGDTGQGGSNGGTGGKGGSSGGDTGGQGGTGNGGKGGTDQGGTDPGGADSGGTDAGGSAGQGGSAPGGAGAGGKGGSGPPGGGPPTGGAGTGGTAGSGPPVGGTGGAPACVGIAVGMDCTQQGLSCPNLVCGLADVGRRNCTCNATMTWACSACTHTGTRFETQPEGITICGAGIADEVACADASLVCGPQGSEYCACFMHPADGLIWDCDAPPGIWGCTGSGMVVMITGGTTAHDHLPLTPAETVDMIRQVRAATMGTSLTLPMDGGHTHALVLTQAQLDTLRGGGMLTGVVSSTFMGHTHTYSLVCGP